jgi:ribose/xylose/arabinose/galactoside ABC-type transport system permease subunit
VGASIGALIFGVVQIGIGYTSIDNNWYRVFLGAHAARRGAVQHLHPHAHRDWPA